MVFKNIRRRIFEEAGDTGGGVIFETPSLYIYIFGRLVNGASPLPAETNLRQTASKFLVSKDCFSRRNRASQFHCKDTLEEEQSKEQNRMGIKRSLLHRGTHARMVSRLPNEEIDAAASPNS